MSEINFEDTIINITLGDIIQQFTEEDLQRQMPVLMQDIDAETKELVDTYQAYISAGNFAEAATYRANNPALETRIWDAFKANSMAVFCLYTYLYARSKGQQCVISSTEPPAASEDGSVIGQVEGDIWFRIDEEKDGVINTTPFQKQADGTYKEFAVAPKLSFATNDDINEVLNDSIEELGFPESLINNQLLKYYTKQIKTDYNDKITKVNTDLTSKVEQCFQSASNGKQLIINAITGAEMNLIAEDPSNPTFLELAESILQYVGVKRNEVFNIYPSDPHDLVDWTGNSSNMVSSGFDVTNIKQIIISGSSSENGYTTSSNPDLNWIHTSRLQYIITGAASLSGTVVSGHMESGGSISLDLSSYSGEIVLKVWQQSRQYSGKNGWGNWYDGSAPSSSASCSAVKLVAK